ncbi:MAG TPA: hypothetical protein VKA61_07150 [Sphingomicrobium sp.]|nr:hypothetical protein [Sphingomicrobium sp.]
MAAPILTRYASKALLDHVLNISAFTLPGTVYLALFTADPTPDGLTGDEPSGNGYARVALTANMAPTSLGTGQAINGALMQFPVATGPWGAVSYFGIMDAASGGNMLIYNSLSSPITVTTGDQLPVSEGSLVLTLDAAE